MSLHCGNNKKLSFHSAYFVWSGGCIQARALSGSSFMSDVTGPLGWFKSPLPGRPNISPEVPLGAAEGYNLRPHSNSSVGHGEAELKPGIGSSDLSLDGSGYVVAQKMVIPLGDLLWPIYCSLIAQHFLCTHSLDHWIRKSFTDSINIFLRMHCTHKHSR